MMSFAASIARLTRRGALFGGIAKPFTIFAFAAGWYSGSLGDAPPSEAVAAIAAPGAQARKHVTSRTRATVCRSGLTTVSFVRLRG